MMVPIRYGLLKFGSRGKAEQSGMVMYHFVVIYLDRAVNVIQFVSTSDRDAVEFWGCFTTLKLS